MVLRDVIAGRLNISSMPASEYMLVVAVYEPHVSSSVNTMCWLWSASWVVVGHIIHSPSSVVASCDF